MSHEDLYREADNLVIAIEGLLPSELPDDFLVIKEEYEMVYGNSENGIIGDAETESQLQDIIHQLDSYYQKLSQPENS